MALLDLQGLEIDEDRTAQRRSRHSRHKHRCHRRSNLSLLLC